MQTIVTERFIELIADDGMWLTNKEYSVFSKNAALGIEVDPNDYFEVTDEFKMQIETKRALEMEKESLYDPTFEEGTVEVLE